MIDRHLRRRLVPAAGVLLLALILSAFAQVDSTQRAPDHPAKPPVFSVATFKPSRGDQPPLLRPMRDGFLARNVTLPMLIASAYENPRIEGDPAWASTASYDFEARLDSPNEGVAGSEYAVTTTQVHDLDLALQSLLKQRCGLVTHTRDTEVPAYSLIIATGGIRMKSSASDDPTLPPNGALRLNRGEISGQGVKMGHLADVLSGQLGRPVVDRTSLTGKFDLSIRWEASDEQHEAMTEAGQAVPSADDPRSAIPALIEKQLGLKLVATKTTVKVRVVDHLERPSAN
jgi:bla regulator protein blaR1